jgi:hypothetical protein
MALKPCKECGQQISTEAKTCPHCGKRDPAGTRIGCLRGGCLTLTVVVVIGLIVNVISGGNSTSSSSSGQPASTAAPPASYDFPAYTRIAYEPVQRWFLPYGNGIGLVVVVSPTIRNKDSLRNLGYTLWYDTEREKMAFIEIFDNARAAQMRDSLFRLSPRDSAFFDRHMLGAYTRNGVTGYHSITMALKPLPEPLTVFTYPSYTPR